MRAVSVGVALAVVLGLAGCGDDPAMSERTSHRLETQVSAVEYAIAGGEYDAAREGLNEIRATTVRLADQGDVEAARASEIIDAIEEVDLLLVRLEEGQGGS